MVLMVPRLVLTLSTILSFSLLAPCFVSSTSSKTSRSHRSFYIQRRCFDGMARDFAVILRGGSERDYNYRAARSDPYGEYGYDENRDVRSSYDQPYEMPSQTGDDFRNSHDMKEGDHEDYYPDEYEYRRREGSLSRRVYAPEPTLSRLPDMLRFGNKKIGMALVGGGAVFTMLGISLFFNKGLMRLGNLLFIAGLPLVIGPGRTAGYFLQPRKARATGCLGAGIFLVMVGWPIFGIVLEIFGLLNLFGNMFPILMVLLKQIPIIGSLLNGNNSDGSRRKGRSVVDYDGDGGYDDSYEYSSARRYRRDDIDDDERYD